MLANDYSLRTWSFLTSMLFHNIHYWHVVKKHYKNHGLWFLPLYSRSQVDVHSYWCNIRSRFINVPRCGKKLRLLILIIAVHYNFVMPRYFARLWGVDYKLFCKIIPKMYRFYQIVTNIIFSIIHIDQLRYFLRLSKVEWWMIFFLPSFSSISDPKKSLMCWGSHELD